MSISRDEKNQKNRERLSRNRSRSSPRISIIDKNGIEINPKTLENQENKSRISSRGISKPRISAVESGIEKNPKNLENPESNRDRRRSIGATAPRTSKQEEKSESILKSQGRIKTVTTTTSTTTSNPTFVTTTTTNPTTKAKTTPTTPTLTPTSTFEYDEFDQDLSDIYLSDKSHIIKDCIEYLKELSKQSGNNKVFESIYDAFLKEGKDKKGLKIDFKKYFKKEIICTGKLFQDLKISDSDRKISISKKDFEVDYNKFSKDKRFKKLCENLKKSFKKSLPNDPMDPKYIDVSLLDPSSMFKPGRGLAEVQLKKHINKRIKFALMAWAASGKMEKWNNFWTGLLNDHELFKHDSLKYKKIQELKELAIDRICFIIQSQIFNEITRLKVDEEKEKSKEITETKGNESSEKEKDNVNAGKEKDKEYYKSSNRDRLFSNPNDQIGGTTFSPESEQKQKPTNRHRQFTFS